MIVKKQIYTIRSLNSNLHFNVIKHHLSQYYMAEKSIAIKNNSIARFSAKWEIVQQCFEETPVPIFTHH